MLDITSSQSFLSLLAHRSFPVSLLTLGVAVFPIGIGDRYDAAQLRILAGPAGNSNVVKLQRIEDLPTMVTLGNSFLHKLCSGESYNTFLTSLKKRRRNKPTIETKALFKRRRGCPCVRFGLEWKLLCRPGLLSFCSWEVYTTNPHGASRKLSVYGPFPTLIVHVDLAERAWAYLCRRDLGQKNQKT